MTVRHPFIGNQYWFWDEEIYLRTRCRRIDGSIEPWNRRTMLGRDGVSETECDAQLDAAHALCRRRRYDYRRSFVQRVPDRVDVVERPFLADGFRLRRLIQLRFARLTARRRHKRRDRGRTDMFGRIQIEFHQRHMRAVPDSFENRVGPRCGLRIDGAPAGEAGGQYLERQ